MLAEQAAFDTYATCRATGAFIVVDRLTHATVGRRHDPAQRGAGGAHQRRVRVLAADARSRTSSAPTRRASSPASCGSRACRAPASPPIANAVEQALFLRGHHSYLLDGDNVRHGLNKDLDFTDAGRVENIRRIGEVAKLFVDAGLIVVTAFISPFRSDRRLVRDLVGAGRVRRGVRQHAARSVRAARSEGPVQGRAAATIKNFTGISSPYEAPEAAEIVIDTSKLSITGVRGQGDPLPRGAGSPEELGPC